MWTIFKCYTINRYNWKKCMEILSQYMRSIENRLTIEYPSIVRLTFYCLFEFQILKYSLNNFMVYSMHKNKVNWSILFLFKDIELDLKAKCTKIMIINKYASVCVCVSIYIYRAQITLCVKKVLFLKSIWNFCFNIKLYASKRYHFY